LALWLYAGVRPLQALLFVAAVEILSFATGYLYYVAWGSFITRQDLSQPHIVYLFSGGAIVVSSICYLLAAAIWMPALRALAPWLFAIVLWTAWSTAANWAIREYRPTGGV